MVSSLLISGCQSQKSDWCTVNTTNESNVDIYDAKVIGWPGVLAIGGNFGGFLPVPDEITITWQSAMNGKEEEAKKHFVKIDTMVKEYMDKYLKDKSTPYPQYDSFPPTLFETHKVVLVLKGKVPKRPKNGEIVITYTGEENFDVHYIEKPNDNDS